jgi:hypothetical protein
MWSLSADVRRDAAGDGLRVLAALLGCRKRSQASDFIGMGWRSLSSCGAAGRLEAKTCLSCYQ